MPCSPCARSVWPWCKKQLAAVRAFAALPEAPALAAANKRVGNILKRPMGEGPVDAHVNPALLQEQAERTCSTPRCSALCPRPTRSLMRATTPPACNPGRAARAPVDAFFDDVMVNAEQLDCA